MTVRSAGTAILYRPADAHAIRGGRNALSRCSGFRQIARIIGKDLLLAQGDTERPSYVLRSRRALELCTVAEAEPIGSANMAIPGQTANFAKSENFFSSNINVLRFMPK
jgi:hypothetical protein